MSAADDARAAINRAMATPAELRLAQQLQRAAFLDDPDRMSPLPVDVHPAPLYVAQALAIGRDPETRERLFRALDALS